MKRRPQLLQRRSSPCSHSQPGSQTSSPDSRLAWKPGSSQGGNHPIQNSATLSDPHFGHGWSLPTGVGGFARRGRSPSNRLDPDGTASGGEAPESDCLVLTDPSVVWSGVTRKGLPTVLDAQGELLRGSTLTQDARGRYGEWRSARPSTVPGGVAAQASAHADRRIPAAEAGNAVGSPPRNWGVAAGS